MLKLQNTIKKGKEFVLFERDKTQDNKDREDKEMAIEIESKKDKKDKKDKEMAKDKKDKEYREVAKDKKDREMAEDIVKLDNLSKMTENRLYKLSSVFPFDLFPNQIIIEQKQIIIKNRQFFFASQEYHVLIEDMLMPVVETSIMFAKLKLELGPGAFQQNPPPVRYLKKSEAAKAKRIIMGLLVCHKENINLENLERKEFIKKIEEIGRFRTD